MLVHAELTEAVIGAAIEVHKHLGPGLLESAYARCLRYELQQRNIPFEFEVDLPVVYKGVALDAGYKMDLVVAGVLVVELKSVEVFLHVHEAQLLRYLRLSGKQVG